MQSSDRQYYSRRHAILGNQIDTAPHRHKSFPHGDYNLIA
jgi:hypothetical protein